jgi:hypothetical protein
MLGPDHQPKNAASGSLNQAILNSNIAKEKNKEKKGGAVKCHEKAMIVHD